MISKIYWIDQKEIGGKYLGIMPRPRGNDWLEDEVNWLTIRDVDYLVSLLEWDEIRELNLEREEEFCIKNRINFINFPIEDMGFPKDQMKFILLIEKLSNYILEKKKVVIHCRMGIGRSSLLASGILIKKGVSERHVFDLISKHRELEVPDTEEQKKWILKISDRIK